MHKEKTKGMSVFVVPGRDPALLGMPHIEILDVLTIKYNTIGRQLASDNKANKRQRNCQCERAVQRGGRKLERYVSNWQDIDLQKQCNADNAADTDESWTNRKQHCNAQKQYNADNMDEPDVVPNAIVMGNNNNRNKSLLSDLIINENQKFYFRASKCETNEPEKL